MFSSGYVPNLLSIEPGWLEESETFSTNRIECKPAAVVDDTLWKSFKTIYSLWSFVLFYYYSYKYLHGSTTAIILIGVMHGTGTVATATLAQVFIEEIEKILLVIFYQKLYKKQ